MTGVVLLRKGPSPFPRALSPSSSPALSRLTRDASRRAAERTLTRARVAYLERRVAELEQSQSHSQAQAQSPSASQTGVSPSSGVSVPAGARTRGGVDEFRGHAGGSVDGVIRGHNVTRVSYTLYKVLRLFGFAGMIDSPAGAHAEWMDGVVRRVAYDAPRFRYRAVDGRREGVERARRGVDAAVDGEFVHGDVENGDGLGGEGLEVLFHWTELDGERTDPRDRRYVAHVGKVLARAREKHVAYVVLAQFPRLNGPTPAFRKGRWTFVGNEKEDPFLLNEYVRGVVPVGVGGKAYMCYLTVYAVAALPAEQLQEMARAGAER